VGGVELLPHEGPAFVDDFAIRVLFEHAHKVLHLVSEQSDLHRLLDHYGIANALQCQRPRYPALDRVEMFGQRVKQLIDSFDRQYEREQLVVLRHCLSSQQQISRELDLVMRLEDLPELPATTPRSRPEGCTYEPFLKPPCDRSQSGASGPRASSGP
jgi:hypothetical protein